VEGSKSRFATFFGAGRFGVFGGYFAEMTCLDVVFWWRERGGMRGKRGVLTVKFLALRNTPGFGDLFFGAPILRRGAE
jgi:hypothetical protein